MLCTEKGQNFSWSYWVFVLYVRMFSFCEYRNVRRQPDRYFDVWGLSHSAAAKLISESFARRDRKQLGKLATWFSSKRVSGWPSYAVVCRRLSSKQPELSWQKIPKYTLYQTVSVALLFVSVQSKHRNSLFRYRSEATETNILFRIVSKLVSVPQFRLFRIEISFEEHPMLVWQPQKIISYSFQKPLKRDIDSQQEFE